MSNSINWGKHVVLAVGPEEEERDSTWVTVDSLPTIVKDMDCEGHEWETYHARPPWPHPRSFQVCSHCGSVKR
jgi:hypothetical protein